VSPGSPLVTLEAMKMETVLRATKRGRIKSVIPALKSSVEVDDLLVLLE
jgi:pyruvate carboxylase